MQPQCEPFLTLSIIIYPHGTPHGASVAVARTRNHDSIETKGAELTMIPQNPAEVGVADAKKVMRLIDRLEELASPLMPGDERLPDIIARCVALKRDIVEADERERGLRM